MKFVKLTYYCIKVVDMSLCRYMHRIKFCVMCNFISAVCICWCIWVIIFTIHGKNNFKFDTTGIRINKTNYLVGSRSFRSDIQKPRQMENAARDIQDVYKTMVRFQK
jgi:hypothetical protein